MISIPTKLLLLLAAASGTLIVRVIAAESSPSAPSSVSSKNQVLPFSFDKMKWEKMSDRIYRKHAMGTNGMTALFLLEKGAFIPEHNHPSEQITQIVSGRVEIVIDGVSHMLGAGDSIVIPPNKPHSFRALEDTLDMDFFSPVRLDWLTGSANYFATPSQSLELIEVASFEERPGNVHVTAAGEVFATFHPLGNPSRQVVRVKTGGIVEAFPQASWQRETGSSATATTFDSPLGITSDKLNRVWVADMGMNLGRTRLFAFDANSGTTVFELTLPDEAAPKGSFVQDLVVDSDRGFVYLADIARPGILVVDIGTKAVRRVGPLPVFAAEDVDLRMDGKVLDFRGGPARIAINPITLAADGETLYFGAMNSERWHALPARLLREGASDADIATAVWQDAGKPVSAGAATDASGNHYFTNLGERGVDFFKRRTGTLEPLIRDPRLDWCDNISIGPDGFIYIVVNQLHKTPAFSGAEDKGKPPYFIYKSKLQR